MAAILGVLSVVSTAIGTIASVSGQLQAGENAKKMGEYQQKQYAEQANEAVATGQRAMLEQQRKTQLVQSQLVARAGASGVDPNSNSVLDLGGQIAKQGEYEALMDLSKGEDQGSSLTNMGQAAKYQGELANAMAPISAAGTVASGAGSIFKTLGSKGFTFG